MKYKMIVTDLDRTLLRADGSISNYTLETLIKLKLKGIKVVFATARPIRDVKRIVNDKFSFDSCIYHNGAVVQFEKDIIFHKGICNAVNIVQDILKHNPLLKISIEACDTLYANFNVNEIWPKTSFVLTKKFEECRQKNAEKILIPQNINNEKYIDKLNVYEYINKDLYLQVCEKNIAMILHREAKKINGIRLVANMYGIDMKDILAFGDDYNDIEMIKKCGLGVAVCNAYKDVKEVAADICKSNEEDGVARYINDVLEL